MIRFYQLFPCNTNSFIKSQPQTATGNAWPCKSCAATSYGWSSIQMQIRVVSDRVKTARGTLCTKRKYYCLNVLAFQLRRDSRLHSVRVFLGASTELSSSEHVSLMISALLLTLNRFSFGPFDNRSFFSCFAVGLTLNRFSCFCLALNRFSLVWFWHWISFHVVVVALNRVFFICFVRTTIDVLIVFHLHIWIKKTSLHLKNVRK